MNSPQISIVEEYRPELDALSPRFKDMEYPVLVIMTDDGMVILPYTDMDILFNRFIAATARVKRNNA